VLAAGLVHAAAVLLLLWAAQAGGERRLPAFRVALMFEAPSRPGLAASAAAAEPAQAAPPVVAAPQPAQPPEVAPPTPAPLGVPKLPPAPAAAPAPLPRPRIVAPVPTPAKRSVPQLATPPGGPAVGTQPQGAQGPAQGAAAASAGGAAAGAATPGPGSATVVDQAWEGEFGAWLQAHKSYPLSARERGEEGDVTLGIIVARDGRVLEVALTRGSGFASLDDAALAMLRDARVPPFPTAMPQARISVTVPVRYTLER
jgi:protein TonB